MKIMLKDIRAEGIDIDYEISAAQIGLDDKEYLYLTQPLRVKIFVERVENTILVKGKAGSRYHSFCSRTLVPVERNWSTEFLLDYAVGRTTEFIDPDEEIRQEVILALPVKVLCDEEMKKEKAGLAQASQSDELKESSLSGQKTYQPFADLKLKEK